MDSRNKDQSPIETSNAESTNYYTDLQGWPPKNRKIQAKFLFDELHKQRYITIIANKISSFHA